MTPDKPSVGYWHLWTDSEGISHQKRCALTHFDLQSMQPPAAPQWQGNRIHGPMTFLVTVQPVGWIGTWHENPAPQWIVPLSGRWFVESMDGTHVEMGAGEISFGGDQNCRERDGRKGHRSGTIGEVPAVLLVIQLDESSAPSLPCGFE
jgi:hypothetical protein